MAKASRRGWRRGVRAVGWLVVGVLVLVALAVVVASVAVRTPWGREQVRARLEAQLTKEVTGKLEIGPLTDIGLGGATAQGVRLLDPLGRVIAQADRARFDITLPSLLERHVQLDLLRLERAQVFVRRDDKDVVNVFEIFRPSKEPGKVDKTPWRTEIRKLVVDDARLSLIWDVRSFDGGGGLEVAVIEGLRGHASLTSEAGWTRITVDEAEGRLVPRGAPTGPPLEARGLITMEPKGLTRFTDAHVRVARSTLDIPHAWVRNPMGAIEADGRVFLAAGDVPWFLGTTPAELAWDDDVTVEGKVTRALEIAPWGLDLKLRTATARLDVVGEVGGDDWEHWAGVESDLKLRGGGRVRDVSLDHVEAEVATRGGTARGKVRVRHAGAEVEATGRVRLVDGVRIEEAHVRGQASELAKVVPRALLGRPRLGGAATFDLHLAGPPDALAVRGVVTGRGLRYASDGRTETVRARDARLDVDLTGVPQDLAGTAKLRADEVSVGGSAPMKRVRVQARLREGGRRGKVVVDAGDARSGYELHGAAVITRAPGRTVWDVGKVRGRAGRLAAEGRGGRFTFFASGRVDVSGLELRSPAGRISLDGTLEDRRTRRARGRLELRVDKLRFERLVEALPGDLAADLPRAGALDLEAHLTRMHGAVTIDAKGTLAGCELGAMAEDTPAPPLFDGALELHVGKGRLSATGEGSARGDGGRVRFTVDVAAPRDPLDLDAWERVDLSDLKDVHIYVQNLSLETVHALTGVLPDARGRVQATLVIPAGGRRIEGSVLLSGVRVPPLRNFDATLSLVWDASGASLRADTVLGGTPFLQGQLELDAPLGRVLADWKRATANAPVRGHLHAHDFPLARVRSAGVLDRPIGGLLDLEVEVAGTPRRPTATLKAELENGVLDQIAFERFDAVVHLDPVHFDAELNARERKGGQATARVDLHWGRRDLAVSLRARAFDLGFLEAFARSRDSAFLNTGGRLEADLRLTGSLDDPRAHGWLRVNDGRFVIESEARRVTHVQLRLRAEGKRLDVAHFAFRSNGGKATMSGQAIFEGRQPVRFNMDLQTKRLQVAAGSYLVSADVRGRLSGHRATAGDAANQVNVTEGMWLMRADLQSARLQLPDARETELQSTGALDDVMYVDEAAARERGKRAEFQKGRVAGEVETRARIVIRATRGVEVRGPDIDASLKVQLVADWMEGRIALAGSVSAERGEVTLFDRRWDLAHARASFDGEVPIDPQIDLRLQHDFKTATVMIDVSGTVSAPVLSLSSNPSIYDEAQLLGFVLGGDPDEARLADRPIGDSAIGAASNILVGQVRDRLKLALPIDVLRVSLGDQGGLQGAQVEVGKWITDNLLLSYRYQSDAQPYENMNEALVEFRFWRRWVVEARYGDRGAGSADVLWRKRY